MNHQNTRSSQPSKAPRSTNRSKEATNSFGSENKNVLLVVTLLVLLLILLRTPVVVLVLVLVH
jgi:hypothetical protein